MDTVLRIENIEKITKEDIMAVSKKIFMHTVYLLEGQNEEETDEKD